MMPKELEAFILNLTQYCQVTAEAFIKDSEDPTLKPISQERAKGVAIGLVGVLDFTREWLDAFIAESENIEKNIEKTIDNK